MIEMVFAGIFLLAAIVPLRLAAQDAEADPTTPDRAPTEARGIIAGGGQGL